jgi:hypothetical protein
MLAGFSVIVSSGITLVVRRLPFSWFVFYFLTVAVPQIFFPRSIETEIAAHDAGARTRGIFSSRHHLTLISQEQELCGTYVYDPEDTPVDSDGASPSSLYNKPTSLSPSLSPSREDILVPAYTPLQSPAPPPPTAQPVPTVPIRLTPNRRRPSLDLPPLPRKYQQQQHQPQRPASNFAERFNNPATSVSRLKHSFRPPIGTWNPLSLRCARSAHPTAATVTIFRDND